MSRTARGQIVDPVEAANAIASGEEPKTEAHEMAEEFTARRVSVAFSLRHPEAGDMRRIEAHSEVMTPEERAKSERLEASMRGGFPADSFTQGQNHRFRCWARCRFQLRIPDGQDWIWSALAIDDELVTELGVVLVEHERRWFRGNLPTDPDAPYKPRVLVPALSGSDGDGRNVPASGGQ